MNPTHCKKCGWEMDSDRVLKNDWLCWKCAEQAEMRVIVAQAKLDGARGLSFYSGSTTTYLDALASELAAAEADLAKR